MASKRTKGGVGVPDPDLPPDARVDWETVLGWRVNRQHLDSRVPRGRLLDVVSDVCGLHAQLMSSATLSLCARVEDVRRSTLEEALWDDRTLVKTWAVRGTLHLVPASEYPRWQPFVDQPRNYERASWLTYFEFTAEELASVLEAISAALDGNVLTREELVSEVSHITGSTELGEKLDDSWGATLKPAAFQGRICYAPSDGRNVRFVRPDQWIGDWDPIDPADAVDELTRRFLATYGPSTREQYARWAGVTDAEAGRRIERLEDGVRLVDIEDGPLAWLLSEDVDDLASGSVRRSVRLLPRFDPYVVGGPRDESAIVSLDRIDDVFQSNGWISAVLLVNGRIVGTWRHDHTGDRLSVSIEPFSEPEPWVRERAEREAKTIAETLDAEVTVSWNVE